MRKLTGRLLGDEGGFTLPEVLVTTMMMTLVMFSLYSIFDMSLRVFAYGNDEVEATENARVALERMEREIRAAYPNNPPADQRVLDASSNNDRITFWNDLDGNGTGNGSNETISYSVDSSNSLIRQQGSAAAAELAALGSCDPSDGPQLEFEYFHKDTGASTAPSADEANVGMVRIKLLVCKDDGKQELTTDAALRNRDDSVSGGAGPGPADTDGDGIPDATDPDDDDDGVPDTSDNCDFEDGPAGAGGCPDRDGDNEPDTSDACPDQSGTAGGCPDADNDGDPDSTDPDDDNDGTLDTDDECPNASYPGDGCPPTGISVNDQSATEGNVGTKTFQFTVTRSGNFDRTTTVNYTTANVSASAGSDYTATSGTVTFNPGVTTQTVNVTVLGDTTVEPNETFELRLSNPSRGTISDGTGVGTITNDDATAALPVLSVNDVTATEGNSGTKNFTFTVTRTGDLSRTASVNYATANVSASSSSDYNAAGGTLSFAVNEASKTVTVQVRGDTSFESAETFELRLSNPTNATVSDGTGVGTITNDDAAPPQCSDGLDNDGDGAVDFPSDSACASTSDNDERSVSGNRAPNAVDDSFTVDNDVSVNPVAAPGVLQNDTDPDGDARIVIGYTQPASGRGTVVLNTDGSGNYRPPNNTFTGTVTFTYTISDGRGGTDTATVRITVVN